MLLRVNEFQLYELAITIHPLTLLSNQAKYSGEWFDLYKARTALHTIFQQRALEVCLNAANELLTAIDVIVPLDFQEAIQKITPPADREGEPILGYLCHAIREGAAKFETVLSAELSNSDTYWIPPKGTHKTSSLLLSAREELPTSVLKIIPDEAAVELDEAGKCLLFDVPTAAGFHLFRATEAVIRQYYEFVVGTTPAKKLRNWGAYIKWLKEKGADPKITGFLEHLKIQYRNPVFHPEVLLTPDDAQILFGVCISAIVMMANAMKATPPALPFPATLEIATATAEETRT
jgi:hypothetical protein